MNKNNKKNKLTIRKLCAAVISFVTALLMGFGVTETETAQVISIIMSAGTMIAYIIGEGMVDANRNDC